uniref:putative nuclease HARBI1 n=1 Tax=Pristiophorus japonicus TaxID=55135 RepID=UPI00398F6D33
MCNISQFAAYTSIQEVTDALYRRRANYISFSMTREHQLKRQTAFLHIARFPWIQGVIDCTHVSLRALQHTPEQFRNRKGFLSLNVQLVCDHNHNIMEVDAQFPGSSHGSFILLQSGVPHLFTGPNEDCGWLLGDKGYALSTWLIAPLRNPRTAAQLAYNESLTVTRTIIKLTIGILKEMFHCLDRSRGVLQYSPECVSIFVVVCCMLHNLAIMRAQPSEDEATVAPVEEEEEDEEEAHEEEQDSRGQPRRRLCRHRDPAKEAQSRRVHTNDCRVEPAPAYVLL